MLNVADAWFAEYERHGHITSYVEPHVHMYLRGTIWHVRGRDRDLVVDSGCGFGSLADELPELFTNSPVLVITHSHLDHSGGAHEFPERLVHPAEAADLSEPAGGLTLRGADYPDELRAFAAEYGAPMGEWLIDALPAAGFDPGGHQVTPAPATATLDEGDVVDLGDQRFRVLHLPGHAPGSIGLLDEHTGVFFPGDVVWDGPLGDDLPGSDVDAYVDTLQRLRELPVRRVHSGHGPTFDGPRMREICDEYLRAHA